MNQRLVRTKQQAEQQMLKLFIQDDGQRSRSRDKLIKQPKLHGMSDGLKCEPNIYVTRKQKEQQNLKNTTGEDKTLSKQSYDYQYPEDNELNKKVEQPPSEKLGPGDCPHFQFRKGQIFKKIYMADQFLADGTFGRVLRVHDINTSRYYAMKVIKAEKRHIENAKLEVQILQKLHSFRHDGRSKIVNIIESFQFGDNYCIIFEELGKSLYDTLSMNEFCGFPIGGLRCILRDLLKGISFMHEIGLTHTDLKPENILFLTKEMTQSRGLFMPATFNVKIVDFGGATFQNEHHSQLINTRQYRAPEVILGCQMWNQMSDIWCIACIAIELYTGELYFSTRRNDFEHLAMIEKSCGPIPQFMVQGIKNETQSFFERKKYQQQSCLKWPIGSTTDSINRVRDMKLLELLIPQKHANFIQLLRRMLVINPKERITASQALDHAFFQEDV